MKGMELRAGRIALSQIVDEWLEHQPLNPRLLATELAELIRSLSKPGTLLPADCALLVGPSDVQAKPDALTLWGIAEYFDALGQGRTPSTVATTQGRARAGAVLVARYWIDRLVKEATDRALIANGLMHSMTASVPTQGNTALAQNSPQFISGSDPTCLAIREQQQRAEGEHTASQQLDTERTARHNAELKAQSLKEALIGRDTQLQQIAEEKEHWRRALIEERRRTTQLQAVLDQYAGIVAFMNPDNPLSPPEGRRLVSAWCDLTENGTLDLVTDTGIGLKVHCQRWLDQHFGQSLNSVVSRFTWALGWPARKRGGAVARYPEKKV